MPTTILTGSTPFPTTVSEGYELLVAAVQPTFRPAFDQVAHWPFNATLDRLLRVEKRLSQLAPRGQKHPVAVMPILMSVLVAMHQLRRHHHTHRECL
jgi:hypothetical protein